MAIVDRPRPQRRLSRGAAALAASAFTVAAALTTTVAGPAAADTATDTIPVGASAWGVAVTPDGARAYVANEVSNTVSVIAIDQAPTLSGTAPVGFVGNPYSHTFTLTGNPAPTVTVTAGALPDGLTLSVDGVLSGTPTTTGRFEFTLTASNGIGADAVLPVAVDIDAISTGPMPIGSLGSMTWTS
ncbi:putative Ig domain-containing protein [Prescottella agglutinans]|uniref:YVTN family beta-propeller protein n=1 Tax=Prescottella agglutinans TaxID=1644129 RepID=A0ABT6MJ00_9NOCA|nr:putative Ig domain-containing protein [Prescottella agglutinans]MDH6283314.1 YVTN family beta-propeller protein [Prescottella agglutinans]